MKNEAKKQSNKGEQLHCSGKPTELVFVTAA